MIRQYKLTLATTVALALQSCGAHNESTSVPIGRPTRATRHQDIQLTPPHPGSAFGGAVTVSGDGNVIAAMARQPDSVNDDFPEYDGGIYIFRRDGSEHHLVSEIAGHDTVLSEVSLTHDGGMLIVADKWQHRIVLYNVTQSQPTMIREFQVAFRAAEISADGLRLAVYGNDGFLRFFHSGQNWAEERLHRAIQSNGTLAMSEDGLTVALVDPGQTRRNGTRCAAFMYHVVGERWTEDGTLGCPGDLFISVALDLHGSRATGTSWYPGTWTTEYERTNGTWHAGTSVASGGDESESDWQPNKVVRAASLVFVAQARDAGDLAGDFEVNQFAAVFGRVAVYEDGRLLMTLSDEIPTATDFGKSFDVSADGRVVVVGAPHDDRFGVNAGSVHVFEIAQTVR